MIVAVPLTDVVITLSWMGMNSKMDSQISLGKNGKSGFLVLAAMTAVCVSRKKPQ
jgi:hypothetical protein